MKINKFCISTILVLALLLGSFFSPAAIAIDSKVQTPTENSNAPQPLTDPSQAVYIPGEFTSTDISEKSSTQKQSNINSMNARNAPNNPNWKEAQQKMDKIIAKNSTLANAINQVKANPNLLLTNNALRQLTNKVVSDSTGPVEPPSGHSVWGTKFAYAWNFPYTQAYGCFAKQYISRDLSLVTSPDEDKTLYAPTMTLPQPCPLEISTRYWHYNGGNEIGKIEVYDFNRQNEYPIYGWTGASVSLSDPDNYYYIYDLDTNRPYYYAEIQYWESTGQWCAYLFNRIDNDWHVFYSSSQGYVDLLQQTRTMGGWDFFEAMDSGGNEYDSLFAQINIVNPIESDSILVDYRPTGAGHNWVAATSSSGCDLIEQSWHTPLSQTHIMANQYSHWYVRRPFVSIAAVDSGFGCPVYANVYIDGNYAGGANNVYFLTPNVAHSITIDSTGYSDISQYIGGYHQFNSWSTGTNPATVTLCGSDAYITAYYDYYQW